MSGAGTRPTTTRSVQVVIRSRSADAACRSLFGQIKSDSMDVGRCGDCRPARRQQSHAAVTHVPFTVPQCHSHTLFSLPSFWNPIVVSSKINTHSSIYYHFITRCLSHSRRHRTQHIPNSIQIGVPGGRLVHTTTSTVECGSVRTKCLLGQARTYPCFLRRTERTRYLPMLMHGGGSRAMVGRRPFSRTAQHSTAAGEFQSSSSPPLLACPYVVVLATKHGGSEAGRPDPTNTSARSHCCPACACIIVAPTESKVAAGPVFGTRRVFALPP